MSHEQSSIAESQITRLIIPFAFNGDLNTVIEQIKSETYINNKGIGKPLWKPKNFNRQRMFLHISHLLDDSRIEKESIGIRFSLQEGARTSISLPNNRKKIIRFKPKSEEFLLTIGDIELYIFETQIGFIVFDILHQDHSYTENIIRCNYFLKKMYHTSDCLSYNRKIDRDTSVQETISFSYLIKKLTKTLDVEMFFESINDEPSYANLYSSILLPQSFTNKEDYKNTLLNYLYQMRRSFKETYRSAEKEFQLESNNEIIQLFENSYWGVSLEGAAHIAYLTNDQLTDTFFKDNHTHQVKETYFYLYMLALHQHYTLQYFSIQASRLPSRLKDSMKSKQRATIEDLKSKMIFFTLRSSFKQVSHITHQNSLYEMFRSALRIDDLIEELNMEIEALTSITETERQKRTKKFETSILIITTIFVIISTINDSAGIIQFLNNTNIHSLNQLAITASKILSTIILSGIVYLILFLIKR